MGRHVATDQVRPTAQLLQRGLDVKVADFLELLVLLEEGVLNDFRGAFLQQLQVLLNLIQFLLHAHVSNHITSSRTTVRADQAYASEELYGSIHIESGGQVATLLLLLG